MASAKTLAIITRRQDYLESSRLVQMITREHGRCTFLAKGAHRPKSPFLGAIDLLHVVEARVQVREGRGIQALLGLTVRQGNLPFRRDAVRRDLSLHTTDLVRLAMPEGRPDPELFDVLHGAVLLYRAAPRPSLATILVGVELRLLQALGLLPSLEVCPRTGRTLEGRAQVGFAPAKGGFVDLAEGGRRVSGKLPRVAAELLRLDGRSLGRHVVPQEPLGSLHALLAELLTWHLGDRSRAPVPDVLFHRARPRRRIQA